MFHEHQQCEELREWTHILPVNVLCLHLLSFCVTGVSIGLATKVTMIRVSWARLEESVAWGRTLFWFNFCIVLRDCLGLNLNGTPDIRSLLRLYSATLNTYGPLGQTLKEIRADSKAFCYFVSSWPFELDVLRKCNSRDTKEWNHSLIYHYHIWILQGLPHTSIKQNVYGPW